MNINEFLSNWKNYSITNEFLALDKIGKLNLFDVQHELWKEVSFTFGLFDDNEENNLVSAKFDKFFNTISNLRDIIVDDKIFAEQILNGLKELFQIVFKLDEYSPFYGFFQTQYEIIKNCKFELEHNLAKFDNDGSLIWTEKSQSLNGSIESITLESLKTRMDSEIDRMEKEVELASQYFYASIVFFLFIIVVLEFLILPNVSAFHKDLEPFYSTSYFKDFEKYTFFKYIMFSKVLKALLIRGLIYPIVILVIRTNRRIYLNKLDNFNKKRSQNEILNYFTGATKFISEKDKEAFNSLVISYFNGHKLIENIESDNSDSKTFDLLKELLSKASIFEKKEVK